MQNHFKFIIKRPLVHASELYKYQTAAIVTQAPFLYVRWELNPGLDPEGQIALAKSQLKLAMIDAIMNGQWEIENE